MIASLIFELWLFIFSGDLNPPFLISDITQSDEQQERNEEESGMVYS